MADGAVGVAQASTPDRLIDNEAVTTGAGAVFRQRVRLGGANGADLATVVNGALSVAVVNPTMITSAVAGQALSGHRLVNPDGSGVVYYADNATVAAANTFDTPVDVYIKGSTTTNMTVIAVNGVATGLTLVPATPAQQCGPIRLLPGETITLTFTVAATSWVWLRTR